MPDRLRTCGRSLGQTKGQELECGTVYVHKEDLQVKQEIKNWIAAQVTYM